jgi:hypothetical protein
MRKILLYKVMLLLISCSILSHSWESPNACDPVTWEQELNKINWLILKASSLNVINGLYLNTGQAEELRALSEQVESGQLPYIYSQECSVDELKSIDKTFCKLIVYLLHDKPIPGELKEEVNDERMAESAFIRKTVTESQRPGYMANNCLQCHALPQNFTTSERQVVRVKPVSAKARKNIDRVHIEGVLGLAGARMIWHLKSKVDKILTGHQKFLLSDIRCSIVPPDDLVDRLNPGRVVLENNWHNYMTDVRNMPGTQWKDFKPQYFASLLNYLEILRPGISFTDKQMVIENIKVIIEEARELDVVDFEIHKDSLCLVFKNQLRVDRLSNQSKQTDEERQFINAMLLLFPGSSRVYERILRRSRGEYQVGYHMGMY